MELVINCNSWIESLLKKELIGLWIQIQKVDDKLIFFEWETKDIVSINIWSRIWNKLFIILKKSNQIDSFDKLFELIYDIDWKNIIWKWQKIITTWESIKSKLSSVPTIQSISKKAIIKKLQNWKTWNIMEDENLWKIQINIVINKDECFILLNSTWDWLHKRWYRKFLSESPIKENLAFCCLSLWWNIENNDYVDFFCWSGTIPIENALFQRNIAPWLYRNFDFEKFIFFDNNIFKDCIKIAKSKILNKSNIKILWYDLDKENINNSIQNAKIAWVQDDIKFIQKDFLKQNLIDFKEYIFVSNPPYWKRLQMDNIFEIYEKINEFFEKWKNIKWGIITSYNDFFQKIINKKSWKLRKLYNWWELCHFYKFL